METIKFKVEELDCPACRHKIETSLRELPGVKKARATLVTRNVKIVFDETQVTEKEIKDTVEKLGYPIVKV